MNYYTEDQVIELMRNAFVLGSHSGTTHFDLLLLDNVTESQRHALFEFVEVAGYPDNATGIKLGRVMLSDNATVHALKPVEGSGDGVEVFEEVMNSVVKY